MNYAITGKNFTSNLFSDVVHLPETKVLTEDLLAKSDITFTDSDVLYIPSESSVAPVLQRLQSESKRKLITTIKNKLACREMLSALFPDFYFEPIQLKDLESHTFPHGKRFVVKPVKGFFCAGVRFIEDYTDMTRITREITDELSSGGKLFSADVLSTDELMIEQFIHGEEYAVDMYYNSKGKPVIINIYHHPIPSKFEYAQMLYYSNKAIFEELYEKLITFFEQVNTHMHAQSFPIHAEFKYENRVLVPIEFNAPRFGGFGLADLAHYAYGFNPFTAFFTELEPDWDKIWQKHGTTNFAWVLAYNGSGLSMRDFQPNHQKFKALFKNVLHYHEMDYLNNPVFGIAYIREDDIEQLFRLLAIEFRDFCIPR